MTPKGKRVSPTSLNGFNEIEYACAEFAPDPSDECYVMANLYDDKGLRCRRARVAHCHDVW